MGYTLDIIDNAMAHFQAGEILTEAPSDSGVAGFVGWVDPIAGIVTPIAIGFGSPSGMLWVLS